jgi:hypothetical protein
MDGQKSDLENTSVKCFSEEMPDCRWFAFVDPEDPDRWIVGWKDSYHIREEGGSSYRHNDPRLTWWYPLPNIPKSQT